MSDFKVFVQNLGGLSMIDVSAIYDDAKSDAKESARDGATESTLHFRFQKDTPDLPDIREGAEAWWGWQTGGTWQADHVNGGFIMVSRGTLTGDTHEIDSKVSSFDLLLTRRGFKGWPTGNDATGIPTGGIIPPVSVLDLLVANGTLTGGASGIIRAMLPGLDYSGVAPAFASLLFTAADLPSTSDPDFPYLGQWSFTTVDKVLPDIAGAIRKVWPAVRPVWWVEAAAFGSEIRPRFVFRDNADTGGTLRGRFALTAGSGDYRFE
jgi:hypothetical protein